MDGISERLMAEFAGMVPIQAEGVAATFNVGDNVWVYLWTWGVSQETGQVCQVPAAILIRPRASLWSAQRLIESAKRCRVMAMVH